ncbi:MAG: hypothetical protein Q8Q73_13495 [Stagnimonas sp.]|nr:hypothetical protein [Stagnimonas sp.]
MSRIDHGIDLVFGLPARFARLLSALMLLLLLSGLAVLLLPPLHWGSSAWSYYVQADPERANRAEQMPDQTYAWIKQRVLGVLRGPPQTEAH